MKFKTVVSSSLCNGIQELQLQQETFAAGKILSERPPNQGINLGVVRGFSPAMFGNGKCIFCTTDRETLQFLGHCVPLRHRGTSFSHILLALRIRRLGG